MISNARSSDPLAQQLLRSHPKVERVESSETPGIQFEMRGWSRRVEVGPAELYGVPEFMDNNPMVCADVVGVPTPAVQLALLALLPIVDSGMVAEAPVVMISSSIDEEELDLALRQSGWADGCVVAVEPLELDHVIAVTAMVAVQTPDDQTAFDDLYEERFGRSFFVQVSDDEEWESGLVRATPFARYRLALAEEAKTSMLTIKVMADARGKLGPTGWIHAMDVMGNLEESLGIPIKF